MNFQFINNQKQDQQVTGKRKNQFEGKKETQKFDDKANKKSEQKQQYHYTVAENTSSLFANYTGLNSNNNNNSNTTNPNGNTNMFLQNNLFGNNPWNQQNNN
jgi:hypothetical protein